MIAFTIIIAILFLVGLKSQDFRPFDKDKVVVLKPFLALGIVLSHLSSYSIYLHDFQRWGPLIVGIFFFISGYGLSYSLHYKVGYIRNFFLHRIAKALLLPYMGALLFYFVLNGNWSDYSFFDHISRSSGPSLIPNDWFIFALVYCYMVFWIGAECKAPLLRRTVLFAGPLLLVVFTAGMGYGRNWWVCTMAFAVGAFYQNWESAILRIISNRKGYIASNFACFLLFAVLIACSALFGNIISTILAYSLLPLWVVAILVPLDCSKAAKNRIVFFGGTISYEVYLVHGIVMNYLNRHTSLDSMAFAVVTLITSFIVAVLLKYMVSFVGRITERALSLLTGNYAKNI